MTGREKTLLYVLAVALVLKTLHCPETRHTFDNTSELVILKDGSFRRLCIDRFQDYPCGAIEGIPQFFSRQERLMNGQRYQRYADNSFRYQDTNEVIGYLWDKNTMWLVIKYGPAIPDWVVPENKRGEVCDAPLYRRRWWSL